MGEAVRVTGAAYGEAYRVETAWFRLEHTAYWPAVPVVVADPEDESYGRVVDYDSRCGLCFLGHAHSEEVHLRSTAAPDSWLERQERRSRRGR